MLLLSFIDLGWKVRQQNKIESTRDDFPSLKNRKNDQPPIYFDNACTTLVPQSVIDSMDEYYTKFPGCGGWRSRHWFAREVTTRIDGDAEAGIPGSRQTIGEFINARSAKEIIFTLNTSHAINLVASGFQFTPGDVVLLTGMEHNSNLIPWLRLQKKGLIRVDIVAGDKDGRFNLESLQQKMENNPVKLVSMASTSNLTGYSIPAAEIVKVAHRFGARVLLDGAQTVPHKPVDVKALDVDFLAFSIHKMCGPKGVGILYGKKELLQPGKFQNGGGESCIEPSILGGGTVSDVTYNSYELLDTPERFEVGVQNYPGQIAAGAAVKYLQQIGMDNISSHEALLNSFLTDQLLKKFGDTGWFKILGPEDPAERGGILTFEVKRPNAIGISDELNDQSNIMIRDGAFCVHAYLNHLFGKGWTQPHLPAEHRMVYRVSLYFYNTVEECRLFVDALNKIFTERGYI